MKRKLHFFDQKEDELILNHWWSRDGKKLVLEKIGHLHSEGSISERYYRLLKKMNVNPREYRAEMHAKSLGLVPAKDVSSKTAQETKESLSEEEFSLTLEQVLDFANQQIDERMMEIQKVLDASARRVASLEEKLQAYIKRSSLVFSALSSVDLSEPIPANLEIVRAENEQLSKELSSLKEEYTHHVESQRKTYEELQFWLGKFLGLNSIEKVATLSDFIPRIKAVVDRFGGISFKEERHPLEDEFKEASMYSKTS